MYAPRKPPPLAHRNGFLHNGRIVWAVAYRLEDGTGLIMWLDRDGNSVDGEQVAGPGKAVVTVMSGDSLIMPDGTFKQVAWVRPFSESRQLTVEDLAWWHAGPE